ncbi:MAG: hypothetical protein DMF70_00995, partial [Acidobacteria bacterium]
MLLQIKDVTAVESADRAIRELLSVHAEWFFVQDGGAPLALANNEFDFSIAHSRLIFSSWTETGSRSWRITSWEWTGEKLLLEASRKMGADVATLELVPRASAKAIVASITAARQTRCEKLARIASESLSGAGIERAVLSPGMRRDQPGRYARIVLRRRHERLAATATVAQSDARNVDSLFSSALLWFRRVRQSPRRPFIEKLLMIVEHQTLEAARQRHVLLRDELRQRIELFEIDDEWQKLEPVRPIARKHLWLRRLARFPPV